MTRVRARMARLAAGVLVAAPVLVSSPGAHAQIEVLTPDMVARLEPGKERPLALSAHGDVARFIGAGETWSEGAPPIALDLDKDGVRDFVVFSFAEDDGTRRAIVIHEWGDADDVFGKAVFYLIVDAESHVLEWGGTYRLHPRAAPVPAPDPPSTPPAASPAAPEPPPTGQPSRP